MADEDTSSSAVQPSSSSPMPQKHSGFTTTTISTISLQSGETRLVIALLQSQECLQLKVLEGAPEITQLGATLSEALVLQGQHEEVLLQLQSKQSPVEELLRQADQLISAQRPRAEVYAAMAESLGVAWKDVNSHLELRKHILELNVAYQSRAEECLERMLALETACRDTNVPVEIEAVQNLLARLHDLKRMMLEALMVTLQNGRILHEKISEIAAQGTLDSRPAKISCAANFTISQIEHWLEDLHDRRKVLEIKWQSRKTQLEQCLSLSLLAKDLKELDELLFIRKESLQNTDMQLGDSASSAELILHEHKKLINEAREFQDRCLKITKETEKLTFGGHFAGEQATIQAYAVLSSSVEYLETLEERDSLLKQCVSFFRSSRTTLTKLDQLEIQLTTTDNSLTNSKLVELHFKVSKSLEEIVSQPLQEGYSLLERVGHTAFGAQGVKSTIQELENRKMTLDNLCTAHKEENVHISKTFTEFLERQNELYSWLVSIAEAFLQGHQDMGSVLAMADDFMQLHQQLLKDLQNKGIEINDVLLTLPPILEKVNDVQRLDIDEKVDTLHSHWLSLKSLLESRIDLAYLYVKFHSLSVELTNDFDAIEVEFRKGTDEEEEEEEEMMNRIEQNWLHIQQVIGQLTNLGKLFTEESIKIGDPYLDVKRACLCVETLLEHFANRQLVISQSWGTWQTNITTEREFNVLWDRNIRESNRIMDWISKLHCQLYPVLTGECTGAKIITKELEEKLQTILPELKRAQTEIELRVKTAETLAMKGEYHGKKEATISKLMELHNELNDSATDYQILLQMLISFFKKLCQVEKTVESLQSQYHMTRLPNVCSELDLLIKEHESSEQTLLELFRFTQSESEQIINRIIQQEPEAASHHDTRRVTTLLDDKKMTWKRAWDARKLLLEEQQHICQFDSDLEQINSNISDLSKQLNTLKGQYGESLSRAKATSVAFVYFEKTIQMLEIRIQTFLSTTEQILKSEYNSSHVESKLNELETKWSDFMSQVKKTRHLIDTNIEYFTLVEEAEEWFRIGSKLLITIARKSTAVRRPQAADQLLTEVEDFLKDDELLQQERINKISRLAEELHGDEASKQVILVRNEKKEMVDSFTIIRKELHVLAHNLRAAEEQRERQKKEMEEAEAILATAKAEATAAKAAAAAAEEARRAAETAAKILQDAMPIIEKVEEETAVIPRSMVKENDRLQKTPSPPSKRAKVSDEIEISRAPCFTVPLQDATVQEGQGFTFECRVTGFPVPGVTWHKDGISIQDNPDYRTSYSAGICTLAIEETFSEDSARFTCKATNTEGSAQSSATLSVQEAEPEQRLFPPVFIKRIEERSAKEGSTLFLMCTVEGNPLPTVQWFKNTMCIDNSSDYIITYNNGEAVIKFEEVFLEDQAEYSCHASNPLGTAKCSAKLIVEPLESTEAPLFISQLSNIMARAGGKIQLECEARGLPMPELIWTHNDKIIKDSQDIKLQYENGKGVLIIKEAFPKDAGIYRTVAKNVAGEATCSCNVSVKGRLPTETSDSEIASDFEPIKPSIHLSLKDIFVLEGQQVRLECIIVGQPEPEVIWYHNNHPVKESSDFQLLFQGDRCSLVIHEAYLEDAGEYKVVAINSGGEASSKCDLTVKSLCDSEPVTNSQQIDVTEVLRGTPPKFSKLVTDIFAYEGDQVVIKCSVLGHPKPNIKWFLNNQEITDAISKEFKEDAEGNVSLILPHVSSQDKGIYTIRASNSFGEAECSSNLMVKPVQSQETQSCVEMQANIPPSFKEIFTDRKVPENTDIKFQCTVTGKPSPKVLWLINNKQISGNDVLISTNDEEQVLIIQNVRKINSGNVTCVAENDTGKASCSARLEVVDSENVLNESTCSELPATEDTESSCLSTKQSIFSSEEFKCQSSPTTLIRESESNMTKHVIPCSEQNFQEVERKSVQVQSLKFQEVYEIKSERLDAERQSSTTSRDTEESQDTSVSTYVTPTASPRFVRKSVAPRFISPLNGKIVDENAQVVLQGIIDGYPPPTVSWTKNGQELISVEGKLSINYDHNKVEVIVENATVQDAGQYTCKAENNVGCSSSTADVVIKKTCLPPVFGRRLHAQSVEEGGRVVMEVEITGIPDPLVSWYRNGQQILTSDIDSSFRSKVQGISYLLVIDKVSLDHSGQYLVKAVNSKGEATSMADIVVNKPESQLGTMKEVILDDISESKIEKLAQPQTPVSEAAAEIQHHPVTSSHSQTLSSFTNSSFMTATRIISQTTKTEKQTVKLGDTPSLISLRPEELLNEHTIPTQEETKVKMSAMLPNLPISSTEEFKTEFHTNQVERNILSPLLHTVSVKETQINVESQSATENVGQLKVDGKVQVTSTDQNERKEMPEDVESHTYQEDKSINEESSISNYKSLSPSEIQSDVKTIYIDIKSKREEPQESAIKSAVVNEESVVVTTKIREESGVETASVSKKKAYEFFINKIKEYEEENIKPVRKPIKLPTQEVRIFKGSSQAGIGHESHDKTEDCLGIPSALDPMSHFEPMISQVHSEQRTNRKSEKHDDHQHQLLSDSFVEELCVRHEPPPENINISKSEMIVKSEDDAVTRIKELEESHQILAHTGMPNGDSSIFPASVPEDLVKQSPCITPGIMEENITKEEADPHALEHFKDKTTCKELLTDVFKSASSMTATTFTQPLIVPAVTHLEPLSVKFREIQTHTPKVSPMEPQTPVTVSTLQTQTESLATTAVPVFNSRHISEAVNQETHLPVQLVPSESFQLVSPKTSSEGLVMEKSLTPFESKSELFLQTSFPIKNSSDVFRDVSPRYSIESSSMNKLWIPETRELEISIPNSFSVDSKKNDGAVSPKPSIEGLAMDKLWAHKHPDSSLKKVWPPPQHSENKPVMPWTTKFASDKIQYTVESAVGKKEEINLISYISATKDVSNSVPMPSPNPNIMKSSETKLFPLEINQPSPTLAPGESHQPPPILLTSGPASDSSARNLILPTSKPPPATHYIANTSVIHSAAVVDNEIHTAEMFTNTEIKEEKIEVSKSLKHEITNISPPAGDKIKQHENMKICPSDSNESFQTKLVSAVDVSAPYQKVGPPSVSVIIKEKFEKNLEVKPHDNKKEPPKTLSTIEKQPFRYPDLEPSFFQTETTKNKPIPCPPPPKPSKFIKGEFMGSDYESDFDSHIPSKWRPYDSDTEELSYRRVKPPSFTYSQRPKSTESSPLPPCCFEKPLPSIGLLRPIVDKVLNDVKEIKSTPIKKTISALQTNSDAKPKFEIEKKQQTNKSSERDSPVPLKPGSPPEYVQPMTVSKAQESQHHSIRSDTLSSIKNKLDSPKSKTKFSKGEFPESGYMADTDEPGQFKYTHHKSTIKHEESLKTAVEKTTLIAAKTSQQNSQIIAQTHTHKPHRELQIISQTHSESQQHYYDNHHLHKSQQKASISEKTSPYKLQPAKFHHKYLDTKYDQKGLTTTGSTKSKELISTITSEVPVIEEPKEQRNSTTLPCKLSPLSPFPIKNVRQTHPSPSKFFKGEFRESDYESDYESRIPPKWKPADSDADEPKYRPVHPVLSQKEFPQSLLCGDKTPTPPTEFDKPPEFRGPPRPKFEPIEKPSQTFKIDVIHKSSVHHQRVFKPKPVTPRTVPPILTLDVKLKESEVLKPDPRPEMGYSQTPPNPKINIAPSEKAEQIETSKVMNFAESTEHIHRVVNVQETTHIIKFQEKEKDIFHSKPEGFSFITDSEKYIKKRPLLSVPKKFVPGDFYESEYESDLESVKIKPKWTPGNSDTEEPLYRSVRPPKVTSSHRVLADTSEKNTSQTVSKESNLIAVSTNITQATAMQRSEVQQKNEYSVDKVQNDERCKNEQNGVSLPVAKEIIPQQNIQLVPGEPPEFCYTGDITSVTSYVTSKHMSDMKNTFMSKAQQFASDVITDVTNTRQNVQQEKLTSKQVDSPGAGPEKVSDDTQAYREESRIAEYGTKHIDPETGLIYFKYDFGYEFGIVFPHEGKKQEGSRSKYSQIVPKQTEDIEVPVIHEKNIKGNENMTRRGTDTIINSGSKVPQFKPKKFTHFKSVKWDPASESEMSEVEGDFSKLKKADSLPQSRPAIQIAPHIHIPCTSHWEPTPPSPLSLSLSPSLPSLSPCTGPVLDSTASPGGSWQGLSPIKSPRVGYGRGNTPTPPSTPSTPGSTAAPLSQQLCKPPTFITALRDIAVMKGQTVCFECIVQAEPPPNILWAKDGRLLENSKKHQIHFRNGVCRLTLTHTYPEDNGNYTCTATNKLGTVKTSGLLQVPGETCFLNK